MIIEWNTNHNLHLVKGVDVMGGLYKGEWYRGGYIVGLYKERKEVVGEMIESCR